ncbi:MAG: S-4TM family putative pore-forming effector [Chloroflexota bacterium]|nr:S-4TM family putative pore-forming effector [Chloroflexota bacterium]
MNTIPQEQNEPRQLDLLAAQRELYREAKAYQAWQIFLSVPGVILFSVLVAFSPQLQAFAALYGVVVAVSQLIFFTPRQKALQEQAAKVQEQLDCKLLDLPWRQYKVGNYPDPETIVEYAQKHRRDHPDMDDVRDWYPIGVGQIAQPLATIICQRSNLRWDARLRLRYANWMLVVLFGLCLVVLLLGLIGGLTIEKFVLAMVVPLLPALLLAIRQYKEYSESAAKVERLKDQVDSLWQLARDGNLPDNEIKARCRELQDGLYEHRHSSPLVFEWVYKRLKQEQEDQMRAGADALIGQVLQGP